MTMRDLHLLSVVLGGSCGAGPTARSKRAPNPSRLTSLVVYSLHFGWSTRVSCHDPQP